MSLLDVKLLSFDGDSCLPLLTAGESKVERGIEPRRFTWLEDVRHSVQKILDSVRPQAVAHVLDFFVGKPSGDVILGVGISGDVNRLLLLLKRPHNFREMFLAIGEKWRNDIFSGR